MDSRLQEYNDIRPFEPEELQEVYTRLLKDQQFVSVVQYLYPELDRAKLELQMRNCRTNLDFQKAFCYGFLEKLISSQTLGCTIDASEVDTTQRYTFISNHRDIVLDSAFLEKLLIDAGFSTTCEVAIGDNLLSLPWVKDLVRINKSFIVERSLQPRQMLLSSKRLSSYMHYVINQKHDNIWIAQREGRAKDSNDRTQPALLKMMAMGGSGSVAERLTDLHLVPLTISYEYDPCDYLKAQEFQLKRDNPAWRKSPQDDVLSMQTGIMGWKGRVHYCAAPCIDPYIKSLDPDMPKADFFDNVAAHIDNEIHRRYKLYPVNFIAMDLLSGESRFSDRYSADEMDKFEQYISSRIEKIHIEKKDEAFLRTCLLNMYANPAKNQLAAL